MIFLEVISRAIALDFGYFVGLILGNLFWVFVFYAIMFFFMNGKKTLYFTVLFIFIMLSLSDLEAITGLAFTLPAFLLLYYISKFAILIVAESMPSLKKYLVVLSTLQAYALILAFNFFIK